MSKKYLFLDLEGHNSGRELEMTPREFVRLFQYAWNDGPVHMTTDYDEMLAIVREADFVIGHNIISFDLTALFGYDSIEPLHMAQNRKVIDTFYLANLVTPAPSKFTRRNGSTATETTSPVGHAMGWLSLDNLCHQFGLEGKLGDLKELARKHNPPKTPVRDLDYGLIPLDDPEFLEYAEQDVVAVRELYHYLVQKLKEQEYPGEYVWREMEVLSATVGQMHRNGILVDQEFANQQIEEQEHRREGLLKWLVENYDFPTEGKAPWSTAAGKEATLKVLADFGFTPENTPQWERTPTGAPKLGGSDLLEFTEGTEAEDFVHRLGELKGQRSIPQLVMDNLKPDGKVHPEVTSLQRSGRWSISNPGVTVFGSRSEELSQIKKIFKAAPGKVLVSLDYSSADARAMAALSGDHEFAKRFETDEHGNSLYDAHNLTGEAVFGEDNYYADVDDRGPGARPALREAAKVISHATNYNVGAYTLAKGLNKAVAKAGIDMTFWAPSGGYAADIPKYDDSVYTRELLNNFNKVFAFLKRFKDAAVEEAERFGFITNSWGRRMAVPEGREYTAGPALYGQSTTREQMADAILRLSRRGEYYARSIKSIIHDELLLEFDEETLERDIRVAKECMEVDFDPKTRVGFKLNFPVGVGYGKNWYEASQ